MRLDRMLWRCLEPGASSLEETATKVALAPEPGETVLFFRIDGPDFRAGERMRVADLLIVARREGDPRVVMLYVELKGSRRQTTDALEQLQSAIEAIEREVPADCRLESQRDVRAIVAFAGEAPPAGAWERGEEFRRRIRTATGRHVTLKFVTGATLSRPADLRQQLPTGWPR